MNKVSLYQCAEDVQAVLNHHFDDEQCASDTLEAVLGQFETKAQSVIAYHLNQLATINLLDEHIKSMQDKKKVMQKQAEKLKDYLHKNMESVGIKEIKSDDGTFTAKIVKNPPSVDVYDESMLPDEYCRLKREADKTAIKSALQNGVEIQGAKLVTDKTSLRIK